MWSVNIEEGDIKRGGRILDTYLSTPAAPDDCGERSSGEIC